MYFAVNFGFFGSLPFRLYYTFKCGIRSNLFDVIINPNIFGIPPSPIAILPVELWYKALLPCSWPKVTAISEC